MACKLIFNEKPKGLISRIRHKYYLNKMLKELKGIEKPKAPKKGAVGEKRFDGEISVRRSSLHE